jgi:hypothetical protein
LCGLVLKNANAVYFELLIDYKIIVKESEKVLPNPTTTNSLKSCKPKQLRNPSKIFSKLHQSPNNPILNSYSLTAREKTKQKMMMKPIEINFKKSSSKNRKNSKRKRTNLNDKLVLPKIKKTVKSRNPYEAKGWRDKKHQTFRVKQDVCYAVYNSPPTKYNGLTKNYFNKTMRGSYLTKFQENRG